MSQRISSEWIFCVAISSAGHTGLTVPEILWTIPAEMVFGVAQSVAIMRGAPSHAEAKALTESIPAIADRLKAASATRDKLRAMRAKHNITDQSRRPT